MKGGAGGRVEEERGDVQGQRRLMRAASFVVALAEKPIAPFLLPAHRTGRADFPHPALGRVSRGDMRRHPPSTGGGRQYAQFAKHIVDGKLPASRPSHLVPSA